MILHKNQQSSADQRGLLLPIDNEDAIAHAEVENIARVVAKYLAKKPPKRSAPFNYEWALKLHKEMLGDVWGWAGAPASVATHTPQNAFQPLREALGKQSLQTLFADLHYWQEQGIDLTEQASRLYARAVAIRPFYDGNKRWAKMLSDIWLKQHTR